MGLFQYRYIDLNGKKKHSFIDAEGLNAAKESLRNQKILVISISEVQEKTSLFFRRKKNRLNQDQLITLTSQLAGLLAAGIPLYESLLSLEEQYRQDAFHSILLSLCEQIKKGIALSEALKTFPHSFSPLYCAMIAAGESVGALEESLEKLADLLSKQRKLKKQLTTALLYPLVLFSFSCLVCLLLLTFVIPSLQTLFEDRDVNRFTKLVMGISHFLLHKKMVYLPITSLSLLGCLYLFGSQTGKRWIQGLLLRTPILKTLIIQTAMARFCRTMGSLLKGGVSIIQALQISRKVMHNPFLENVIADAEVKIVEGSLLSIELKKAPLIPSLVPRMLAIGEEGGNAAAMFHKIADLYEEEVEKTLTRITTLAQPVILVIMGGIVGLIMLAVLLPLTDVNAFL